MKSVERKKQIRSEFFSITETKTDEFSDKLEISEKELIKWINCENELDLSIERDIAHLFGTSVKVLNGENRPKHLIHLLDCEDNCSLCTLDYTKGYQIG